jgi:hypothetical protein
MALSCFFKTHDIALEAAEMNKREPEAMKDMVLASPSDLVAMVVRV